MFKPSTDAESLLGSIKKKKILIGVRGSPGVGSQSWGVFVFLTSFDGPWTPIPWTRILAQTVFGKSENCIKCTSLPLAATVACDNSALDDASELYEPSKDS